MGHEIEVFPTAAAASHHFATLIAERARKTVAANGSFTLALSGGTEPWKAFALLADEDVPWDGVEIFQVDERIAPDGDDDRNLTHMERSLPAAAWARVRPMPVGAGDPDAGAAEYAALLPGQLDVVHLGLGTDGHMASLVPGDAVLDVQDRDVAVTSTEYQGRRRMTLTYPALDRARELLWLIAGESKEEPLRHLLAADPSIPAGRVRAERSLVVTDAAASGLIGP